MIGFFAGSFDPFTNGHLDILKQALMSCDGVVVGIGINAQKKRTFDKEKMREAILKCAKREGLENVDCVCYDGLTYEAAKKMGCNILVRGIRNSQDRSYEDQIAEYNRKNGEIGTMFFVGANENISSTLVRQNMADMESIKQLVPQEIYDMMESMINENNSSKACRSNQ